MDQNTQTRTTSIPPAHTGQENERLRRVVAAQIGPRRPGTEYENIDGRFRVLEVITDPTEARQLLKRRSAQFAVRIVDLNGAPTASGPRTEPAAPFVVGSVWTQSDRVLKAVV